MDGKDIDEKKDEQIWRRFISGDRLSFEQLFSRHYDALYNYLNAFEKDPELVTECVQDLFVKLWRNHANLSPTASPRHYLLRAIKHVLYNKKALTKRMKYVGGLHNLELLSTDSIEADLTFQNDMPLSPAMQERMRNLTDKQREALYLYYVEDFSYKELADYFEITTRGAYKLIYRALDVLKAEFNR